MVPIAYASSEGSNEPAHPRNIASALTAHIHNEGACRGCEFKVSKALEMIGTSRNSLYLPQGTRNVRLIVIMHEDIFRPDVVGKKRSRLSVAFDKLS